MILKIQTGQNNPILRKKSLPIKEIDDDVRKLAQDMLEIIEKNNGIGLSACQVGKNLRMFVVNPEVIRMGAFGLSRPRSRILDFGSGPKPKGEGALFGCFINPEIIKISKKTDILEEGCLSLPDVFLPTERATSLKIKALDENGKEFKLKAKDLLARVIQHEIDHLNGVLIIDKHA